MMKSSQVQLIKKSEKSHRVARPTQTGFSSPATHYNEPRIDLNDVLVQNASATFYIRVENDAFDEFDIYQHDVLIVDKSLSPTANRLAIVIKDESFKVIRIEKLSDSEFTIWGIITYIIKPTL